MAPTTSRGFTLVELTVVILIIGLLIGGVLVGRDLLRTAETRSALKESAQYIEALKNFQDKYRALPGDFSAATNYWTASDTCPVATITGTCNGDGNGRIINQGDDDATDTHYEQFTAWQHLALAGMIEGNFTGVAGSGGTQDRRPGVNIPSSQLSGGGWGLVSITAADIAGTVDCYNNIPYNNGDMLPNHVLWLGKASIAPLDCNLQAPVLTAREAWAIDDKIDDGIPVTGKVVAQNSSGCIASNAYDLEEEGLICALVFKTGL